MIELSFEKSNNCIVVKVFEPKFTNLHFASFREQVEQKFAESLFFAIDLTNVDYIDSAGIGAVITVNNNLEEYAQKHHKEFKIVLFGANKTVSNLLSILKINTVMPVCDTKEEALQIFS